MLVSPTIQIVTCTYSDDDDDDDDDSNNNNNNNNNNNRGTTCSSSRPGNKHQKLPESNMSPASGEQMQIVFAT